MGLGSVTMRGAGRIAPDLAHLLVVVRVVAAGPDESGRGCRRGPYS